MDQSKKITFTKLVTVTGRLFKCFALTICFLIGANAFADGANEPIPSFYQEAGILNRPGFDGGS